MAVQKRRGVCAQTAAALLVAWLALAAVPAASGGYIGSLLELVQLDGEEPLLQCLLGDDDLACTPAHAELRAQVPDLASTNCAQCSEEERDFLNRFLAGLFRRYPLAAALIQDKYDPTGEYRQRYGDVWRSKGILIYPPSQAPLHALYF